MRRAARSDRDDAQIRCLRASFGPRKSVHLRVSAGPFGDSIWVIQEVDRLERVDEPVSCGGGDALADVSRQPHDHVAQGTEHLGRRTAAGPAGVLSQAHIADVVQAVLDAPVAPLQRQQPRRVGLARPEAGDPVGDLQRRAGAGRASPFDSEDLRPLGPAARRGVGGDEARRRQRPSLDPPVPFGQLAGGPSRLIPGAPLPGGKSPQPP
jgi:hypothetical protein